MIKDLIVTFIEILVKTIPGLVRDALGKTVEEIGRDIRQGKLIADEAFKRAKADADTLDDIYERRGR